MEQTFLPVSRKTFLTNVRGCFFKSVTHRNYALNFLSHSFIYMCAVCVLVVRRHIIAIGPSLLVPWEKLGCKVSSKSPRFVIAGCLPVPSTVVQVQLMPSGQYISNSHRCCCLLTSKCPAYKDESIFIKKGKGELGA